jgi:hypothetical protein
MQHKIMSAELMFTNFLVEHDIPFAAANHAGDLFKKMFPDSKIAKGFQCGRTKTTALVAFQAREIAMNIAKCLHFVCLF